MKGILALILALCSIIFSCENRKKQDPAQPANLDQPSRDTKAPIQTDSLVYHLVHDSIVLFAKTFIRFKNITPDTIYIINCNNALVPVLEKRMPNGTWEEFLLTATNGCLSMPIVIPPDATFEDTLFIGGAIPGNNAGPAFPTDDVEGEYRIVLSHTVWRYDINRLDFGDTIPKQYRYSNAFYLDDPRK